MKAAFTRRWPWLLLIAAAVVLVVAAGVEGYRTFRLAMDLRDAASELQAMAQADPTAIDLPLVAERIHAARLDAEALQHRVHLIAPLTNRLGWVPRFGPTLTAAGSLADYVASLTAAADESLVVLGPLLEATDSTVSAAEATLPEQLVDALVSGGPHLDAAQTYLEKASSSRQHFDLEDVPSALQDDLAQADQFLPLAQQGLTVLRLLPSLLGAEAPRTYLLVAQNQDELRATGGFISGIGTVTLDGGRIAGLAIGDSYNVDNLSLAYPAPPEPLQRYMLAEQWLVRDANWSPDFPTAAADIGELYTFSTGTPAEGVIAFDLSAVYRILSAIGPVQVPDVSEPIGAENVEDYVHQAWAPSPGEGITLEWWEHRKDFMGELASAMLERIQAAPIRSILMSLAREALALMREKHLLIAVDDPEVAALLAQIGLDGAIQPGTGDFLMLVDSNIGFNKVDELIDRSLAYTIDLRDPAAPRGEVTLHYRHTVTTPVACVHEASYGPALYEDLQIRCYWDYVRLYVPSGAELLEGSLPPTAGATLLSGVDEPGIWQGAEGERSTTAFSGIFVLPTASEAQLSLSYLLPPQVLLAQADGSRVYQLRLSKQPGTEGLPVEVTVLLPGGTQLRDIADWTTLSADVLHWAGRLTQDVTLSVTMEP